MSVDIRWNGMGYNKKKPVILFNIDFYVVNVNLINWENIMCR